MINPKIVDRLGNALNSSDQARMFPTNPGGIQGAIVREGVVNGTPVRNTVPVNVGGSSQILTMRYLGNAPPNGAKVAVVFLDNIIFCLGATSDSADTSTPWKFSAYNSTAISCLNTVRTQAKFNTIRTGGDPTSGYNATSGEWAVPIPGDYMVTSSFNWNFSSPVNGTYYLTCVSKNGSEVRRGAQGSWLTGNNIAPSVTNAAVIMGCVIGDSLGVQLEQGAGSTQSTVTSTGVLNWVDIKRVA